MGGKPSEHLRVEKAVAQAGGIWKIPAYGYLEGLDVALADLSPNMDALNHYHAVVRVFGPEGGEVHVASVNARFRKVFK